MVCDASSLSLLGGLLNFIDPLLLARWKKTLKPRPPAFLESLPPPRLDCSFFFPIKITLLMDAFLSFPSPEQGDHPISSPPQTK